MADRAGHPGDVAAHPSSDDQAGAHAGTRGGGRGSLMAIAAVSVVCGSLPLFLVSAQAVQIREELRFGYVALGSTAAVFNAARALTSVPVGRTVDRLGGRRSIVLALCCTALLCASTALWASGYVFLMVMMAIAGTAQGAGTSAATLLLTRHLPPRLLALSVGVQQAGVPAAAIVSGLAVPAVALTVGWRWSYGIAAGLTALVALVVARGLRARPVVVSTPRHGREFGADRGPVVFVAVGITFAAAASFALTTFVVDYAVSTGVRPSSSGWLLTLASALTVVARVVSGHHASRGRADQLGTVLAFLVIGAVGFVTMVGEHLALIVLGTSLAAAFCWSITGLVYSTVVQFNRSRPGAATGIALTGTSVGGVIGPVVFGWLVETLSYRAAWLAAASWALVAVGFMAVGRARLVAGPDERRRRRR